MICLDILLLSTGFYVFVKAIAELQSLLSFIHFSDLFKKNEEENGVEIPVVEEPKRKYDVAAFKRRIELMKDEEGLYDLPTPVKPPTDFTGTEVITENFELEMDKHFGSK